VTLKREGRDDKSCTQRDICGRRWRASVDIPFLATVLLLLVVKRGFAGEGSFHSLPE